MIKNLKWVVAFIAIVAVVSNVFTCNGLEKWRTNYQIYRDSTAALLIRSEHSENMARAYLKTADSLRVVAAHQTARINQLDKRANDMADSAKVLNDSLDKLVATLGPINPITCRQCLLTNAYLRQQVDTLHIEIADLKARDVTRVLTIDTLRSAVRLDTVTINDLQRQLRELPKPPPQPHLFGVFNLTPNQSFLAGTAFGVVTVFVIKSVIGK